jgi:hypothetical protein
VQSRLVFSSEVPIEELFQIQVMKEEEFDQNLDLAEDVLSDLASSKNSNAGVWMNDFKASTFHVPILTSQRTTVSVYQAFLLVAKLKNSHLLAPLVDFVKWKVMNIGQ